MTVKELRDALSALADEMRVGAWDNEWDEWLVLSGLREVERDGGERVVDVWFGVDA